MKNRYYLLALLIFMASCSKDEVVNTATKTEPAPVVSKKLDDTEVKKIEGVLHFNSWEDFYQAQLSLYNQSVEYCTNYFEPLAQKGFTEEELNLHAQKENFNQFVPIHTFNEKMAFKSLYLELEAKEKEWMKTTGDLDMDLDPFKDVERFESALVNEEGLVYIADKLINIYNVILDEEMAGKTNRVCEYWADNPYKPEFHYKGKRRKIKMNVGPRPFNAFSSTTTYTKGWLGVWWWWFNGIETTVSGHVERVRNGYCDKYGYKHLNFKRSGYWGAYAFTFSWHAGHPFGSAKYQNIIRSTHTFDYYNRKNHAF